MLLKCTALSAAEALAASAGSGTRGGYATVPRGVPGEEGGGDIRLSARTSHSRNKSESGDDDDDETVIILSGDSNSSSTNSSSTNSSSTNSSSSNMSDNSSGGSNNHSTSASAIASASASASASGQGDAPDEYSREVIAANIPWAAFFAHPASRVLLLTFWAPSSRSSSGSTCGGPGC